MGNIVYAPASDKFEEGDEWLEDLQRCRTLDISRKVNYAQFLQHVQGNFTDASLTDIPWSILEHISLYDKIDASFNNISQVSPNLALRIPHLVHLNLSYNSICNIPQNIALLFHLKEFLLRGNKLTVLPDELCLLSNLEMLDLSYNKISNLPKDMGRLKNLTRLNISNNCLEKIPHSLGLITGLNIILASNNCSLDPSQEICDSSLTLLAYLKEHAPEILPCKSLNMFPRLRANAARSQLDDDLRTQNVSAYVQTLTQTPKPASRIKTPLLLPTNATKLNAESLRDKIVGMVYGAVLGDTLGVATELLPREDIEFYYGSDRLEHATIINDEYRSHFRRGKTTCVSDFMLLILDCIIQWSGVLDELEIARRLIDYSYKGLRDLNTELFITSPVVNSLLLDNRFPLDPHAISLDIAQKLQADISEDLCAVPMALLSGLPQFYNLSEVQSNAIRVCRTTHNDAKLSELCSCVASIVALLLQGSSPEDIRCSYDASSIPSKDLQNTSGNKANTNGTLDSLKNMIFSCLECEDFESSLTKILFMGGESRIYGTICGGILGCITGFTHLPGRWIGGLDESTISWLNGRLNILLDMMGLP